jgi:hypothetical protein
VTRFALLPFFLGGCSLLDARVPMHGHEVAEIGLSCVETCAPWACDASYDTQAMQEIACEAEAERFALCICRAS